MMRSLQLTILVLGIIGSALIASCVTYTAPDGTKLTLTLSNVESLKTKDLTIEKLNQTEGARVVGEAAKEALRIQGLFNLGKAGLESTESVIKTVTN